MISLWCMHRRVRNNKRLSIDYKVHDQPTKVPKKPNMKYIKEPLFPLVMHMI